MDIQIIDLNNPILPIQLGDARLVYSKHTFLYYVDLKNIVRQLETVKQYYTIMKNHLKFANSSNHISYHGLAESLLLRTEYLIQITSDKLQNLHPHVRKERGLINIVGTINKWLFGTLDASDGEHYEKAISSLENDRFNIKKELNLQISLSKALINNYNNTITTLSRNQEKLQLGLKKFQISVQNTIDNLQDYLSFQGVITQINLDCQNLITFLDNLENAITFSKMNALHNSIISISQLEITLKYLRKIYKESEIQNFKSLLSYYQFLGTQVRISNSKVIFAIHVPILRPETLTFSHIYPTIQNKSIFVPKYQYLAHKRNQVQFSSQPCPVIEETYFCIEEFHPRDQCTEDLLHGLPVNNCPTLIVNLEEPVVEQITQELVIILPTKQEKLLTKCSTDQFVQITQSVMVKIPETCEIQINDKKFVNDVKLYQGKPLILPDIKLPNLNTTQIWTAPNITKINLEELYHLKDIANHLTPVDLSNQAQNTNWLLVITIGLSIVLVITIALLYRGRFQALWRLVSKKETRNPEATITHSKNHSVIFES